MTSVISSTGFFIADLLVEVAFVGVAACVLGTVLINSTGNMKQPKALLKVIYWQFNLRFNIAYLPIMRLCSYTSTSYLPIERDPYTVLTFLGGTDFLL